ncbi:MAG: CBS domain-containing protein [Nitrososphaeraceae archaeon]
MIDIAEKVKNIDVTNLMTKRVITVSDDQPLQEASKLMYQNNIGSIIILKSNDETGSESVPIGIVTERDIAGIVGFASTFSPTMPIPEVMSKPLLTTTTSSSLKEAADLMQQNNIRRLSVLDSKGKLVGVVTAKDILKSTMDILKKIMVEQDFMTLAF